MSGTMLCVAVVMLGVKFDVQPLPSGGQEYIILVEPLDLQSLGRGNDLRSDLPPIARDVRSFCIQLASDKSASPVSQASGYLVNNQPAPAGGGAALTQPSNQDRSATAPMAASGLGSSALPGFDKFPTAPSGGMPLPKVGAKPGQADWPPLPSKQGKEPGAAFAPPPMSTSSKPLADPKAPRASSNETKDVKKALPPSADKPQAPQASSRTEAQEAKSESPSGTPGVYYSLAAGTAGSSTLMMFFGWVAWDYRRRYYSLLSRFMAVSDPFGSSEAPDAEPSNEGYEDSEQPPVSADD